MTILIVGVLGVVALVDGANAETNAADTRIGATNLAREITEDAHAVDYDSLLTSTIVAALRANSSLTGTLSGSTWVVTRRGEHYTVTVTACKYDDPADGLATSHDSTYCSNVSTTPTPSPDANGDDFRRVDVTISWRSQNSQAHVLKQTAMIVNPSGGLGPRITNMTHLSELAQPDISTGCSLSDDCYQTSSKSLPFTVTTATAASSLHWSASDGSSSGTVSPALPTTSFAWNWDVSAVLDGTYTMSAQAFDDRGVPGDLKTASVVVNLSKPKAPTGFVGGWDTRTTPIVDLRWNPSPEGDIVGYRVYRNDGGTLVRVCPPAASSDRVVTTNSCYDANPPDPNSTPNPVYQLAAVDLQDGMASDSSSNEREGDLTAPLTVPTVDQPPTFPSGGGTLTSSVKDGLPTIGWTDAATDADGTILFYRIYRDPPSLPLGYGTPPRYDYTTGTATTYSDPNPGSSLNHVYYVTAVDDKFNESQPIGPFPALP